MEQKSDDQILEIIFQKYAHSFGSEITYLNDHNPLTELQEKFIIGICKNDINYLSDNIMCIDSTDLSMAYEYIKIACSYSKDTKIIQLLLDYFKTDINDIGSMDDNISCDSDVGCLVYACCLNQNECMIKYLIEECKMDVYYGQPESDCLSWASMHGNYVAIKYLIDNCSMDPNHTNHTGFNCFDIISIEDSIDDFRAILFLIEKTNVENLSLRNDVVFEHFMNFAPLITDVSKLNHLLECAINKTSDSSVFTQRDQYDPNEVFEFVRSFNPLRLNKQNREFIKFDPLTISFNDWKKLVDSLSDISLSDFNVMNPLTSLKEVKIPMHKNDYTISRPNTEQMFEHNNIIYYGDKKTMLGSMLIFKDWNENINFDDIIILDGSLEQYLINLYIDASLNNTFVIDQIQPQHIDKFIKFIDQYPSIKLSVDQLEIELINYFAANAIKYSQYMIDIIEKYQLKYMYIDLHNKKISNT